MTEVELRSGPDDSMVIGPYSAPVANDGVPPLDTLVLEVEGGLLTWSLLDGQDVPAATIDDPKAAQDWLWAVYGEEIALAVADSVPEARHPARPGLPALATSARRLAYAHWAARWWPASTVDGIAPLDERLLERDIAALTEECDLLVAGADAFVPVAREIPATPRAADYALAAGPETVTAPLVLARGTADWDWRRCPPGLIDASERAVSWELRRERNISVLRVRAVAAPRLRSAVHSHLQPRVRVHTPDPITIELTLVGEVWTGETPLPTTVPEPTIELFVPGVGPAGSDPRDESEPRRRLRAHAADRLRRAASDLPDALSAEIAAAAEDDF
ncbi:hypothetical protein ACWDSJ_12510 [Nocardia sp. NPDC003482]